MSRRHHPLASLGICVMSVSCSGPSFNSAPGHMGTGGVAQSTGGTYASDSDSATSVLTGGADGTTSAVLAGGTDGTSTSPISGGNTGTSSGVTSGGAAGATTSSGVMNGGAGGIAATTATQGGTGGTLTIAPTGGMGGTSIITTGGAEATGGTGPRRTRDSGGFRAIGGSDAKSSGGSVASGGTSNVTASGGQSVITYSFGERPTATYRGITQDTDLLSSAPNYNYGWTADFGCSGSPMRVALVSFNISEFLNQFTHGVVISGARLHLQTTECSGCQASPDTTIRLFEVNQAWQEVDSASSPGEDGIPNWNQASVDASTDAKTIINWTAPGAQPPARGDVELAHFSPIVLDTDYVIELPPSLVQGWANNPDSNYGIELVIAADVTDTVTFVASDGDQTKSPLLEIDIPAN